MSYELMSILIVKGKLILNIFGVNAPEIGLSVVAKDSFYSFLLSNISTFSPDQYFLVFGDFNDHVGKAPEGFNGVHGGHAFGSRNADGIRILDFCAAANLAITNTYFIQSTCHLMIW